MRATVVGAGLMGHGIAQVLAAAGATVTVSDPDETARSTLRDRIAANLRALGRDARLAEEVRVEPDLERAVADAEWVFEAAPEDLELKQGLFARMAAAAPAGCILATNSSVMRVSDVAAMAADGARIVGTHWWNPPYLVPLVEVVRGERTAQDTVDRTVALLERLGKIPVRVERDVPGFVGNRLQHALWREAFALVDAGVCDAETVDTVVKQSFGLRLPVLGPMENADLVGLDLTLAIHEYVLPTLAQPSEPAAGLRARVADGRLGMGTGEGWRRWDAGTAQATRRELLEHLRAAT